jgi:hypothetical protein
MRPGSNEARLPRMRCESARSETVIVAAGEAWPCYCGAHAHMCGDVPLDWPGLPGRYFTSLNRNTSFISPSQRECSAEQLSRSLPLHAFAGKTSLSWREVIHFGASHANSQSFLIG